MDTIMKRMPTKTYEELIVWQKAHQMVLQIYKFTLSFPDNEKYGLVSQIRRAAGSVPANIAEGYKRRTKPDKARLMNIAQGSLEECRYYLTLAKDLGYGDSLMMKNLLEEISKMLEAYVKSLLNSGS